MVNVSFKLNDGTNFGTISSSVSISISSRPIITDLGMSSLYGSGIEVHYYLSRDDWDATYDANRIEEIEIPYEITHLFSGEYGGTFSNCTNLKKVTFGSASSSAYGIQYLTSGCFSGCIQLTNIVYGSNNYTIPSTITDIRAFAFEGCTSLKKLYFLQDSKLIYLGMNSENRSVFSGYQGISSYVAGVSGGTVKMPHHVLQRIRYFDHFGLNKQFYGATNMTIVTGDISDGQLYAGNAYTLSNSDKIKYSPSGSETNINLKNFYYIGTGMVVLPSVDQINVNGTPKQLEAYTISDIINDYDATYLTKDLCALSVTGTDYKGDELYHTDLGKYIQSYIYFIFVGYFYESLGQVLNASTKYVPQGLYTGQLSSEIVKAIDIDDADSFVANGGKNTDRISEIDHELTIEVNSGTNDAFYKFYSKDDNGGDIELSPLILYADIKYTFINKTDEPFYISDTGYKLSSDNLTIEGAGSIDAGITGTQSFTVLFKDYIENLYLFSTNDINMTQTISVSSIAPQFLIDYYNNGFLISENISKFYVYIEKALFANRFISITSDIPFYVYNKLNENQQEILQTNYADKCDAFLKNFLKLDSLDTNGDIQSSSNIVFGSLLSKNNFTNGVPIPINDVIICFLSGTKIHTDQGIVLVEKLTTQHTIKKEKIEGISVSLPNCSKIVEIKKNALGRNNPNEDLYVTCDHKIMLKGTMIEAQYLVNHSLTNNMVRFVPYNKKYLYNVIMEKGSNIIANNVYCESLNHNNPIAKIMKQNKDPMVQSKLINILKKRKSVRKFGIM